MAEAIGGTADVAQQARVVPVDDLGAHDADVIHARQAHGRLDHVGDALGVDRGVVVQEEEEVRLVRDRMRLRGRQRTGEAAVVGQRDHAALPQRLDQEFARTVGGSVVDGHHGEAGIRLRGERGQGLAQPSGRVPDDEDHQDGGRALRGDGGGGLGHATRFLRGAEASTVPARDSGRGARRTPSGCQALWFSACVLPACEPRSSCVRRACGLPSSSWLPACELPSSCEPRACVRLSSYVQRACGLPSSSWLPACELPSSYVLLPCCPLSVPLGSDQDAMRFRRRRSRSLIPPQTP